MRVKTSISIPEEKLRALDKLIGPDGNRSKAIERAIDELLERFEREARDARDLEIYAGAEEELEREMEDVLSYQVDV